jgi:hypothetical protein
VAVKRWPIVFAHCHYSYFQHVYSLFSCDKAVGIAANLLLPFTVHHTLWISAMLTPRCLSGHAIPGVLAAANVFLHAAAEYGPPQDKIGRNFDLPPANTPEGSTYYIVGYVILGMLNMVFVLCRSFGFAVCGARAAGNLFKLYVWTMGGFFICKSGRWVVCSHAWMMGGLFTCLEDGWFVNMPGRWVVCSQAWTMGGLLTCLEDGWFVHKPGRWAVCSHAWKMGGLLTCLEDGWFVHMPGRWVVRLR